METAKHLPFTSDSFDVKKGEEVARSRLMEWEGVGHPIYPVDDDGEPVRMDVGCVSHWEGIDAVKIESCTYVPEDVEVYVGIASHPFDMEAIISRWESDSDCEENNDTWDSEETVRVWVMVEGNEYFATDIERL